MTQVKSKSKLERIFPAVVASAGVALIAAIVLAFIAFVPTGDGASEPEPVATSDQSTAPAKVRSLSGKSVEDDRQDALAAATELLTLAAGPLAGEEFAEELTKLDSGDVSGVSTELISKIRFSDSFAEDPALQANTYQALLTFSSLIKQTSETDSIEPLSDSLVDTVYVDQELGVAYVPLSLYIGAQAAFSIELVYIDGEWLLSPYSLIEQIRLAAGVQSGAATG